MLLGRLHERDVQVLAAAELDAAGVVTCLHFAQLDSRETVEQARCAGVCLGPSEGRSDTEMNPRSEGHMTVGVHAPEAEGLGVLEHVRVAVRRSVERRDHRTVGYDGAREFYGFRRVTKQEEHRTAQAKSLLEEIWQQRAISPDLAENVGMLPEQLHEIAEI